MLLNPCAWSVIVSGIWLVQPPLFTISSIQSKLPKPVFLVPTTCWVWLDVLVRLLLASTSEVYGDPEVHPQPENYRGCNTTGIRSCYDEGKRIAETLCFDYHRMHGVEIRVMRILILMVLVCFPMMVVVSNFIVQALKGLP